MEAWAGQVGSNALKLLPCLRKGRHGFLSFYSYLFPPFPPQKVAYFTHGSVPHLSSLVYLRGIWVTVHKECLDAAPHPFTAV